MSKDKNAETEETEGKGGKKKLLLVLLVVVLAAAGAGYFFVFKGSGSAAAEEPVAGEVLSLDPIAVNLAGGGYLKIGVTLQFTEEGSSAHEGGLDGSKAQDLVISTFSQANPADVTGARDVLKQALKKKIIEAYDGEVMDIYYNQYVTQ